MNFKEKEDRQRMAAASYTQGVAEVGIEVKEGKMSRKRTLMGHCAEAVEP